MTEDVVFAITAPTVIGFVLEVGAATAAFLA